MKRKNLIAERNKLNLTQEQLADSLGIAEITIRKIESGASLSNKLAVKMANYFKRPLDYLFPDIFLLNFDTKSIKNKQKEVTA